jgi:hypothetical protein
MQAPRAQQRAAELTKTCLDHLDTAARHMASSEAAMGGCGWDADSSAQLWHQAAQERLDLALDAIEKLQKLGATQDDLKPLWDRVLEAQIAEMES